jgi:hypothetical protein
MRPGNMLLKIGTIRLFKIASVFQMIFISHTASSQNYYGFPDSNAVWSQQGQLALWDIPGCFTGPTWEWIDYSDYSQFYTGNKDTIGSTIYTKIMCSCASGYFCYEWNTGGSYEVSECNEFQFLYGYLRQDSMKRVYFTFFPGSWEYLLYDFNWEVGDTVIFYDNLHEHLDSSNYISSIDSILIDTTYRKRFAVSRFELNDSLNDFEHTHIIEGIGSTRGLLGNYWSAFPAELSGYGINLTCFSQNGKILYPQIDMGECEIVTSTSIPVPQNFLTIYPNPSTNYLNVCPSGYVTELKVLNMLGQVLLWNNYSGQKNENIQLDVSHLPKGTYVLSLSGKQATACKMFMKQ